VKALDMVCKHFRAEHGDACIQRLRRNNRRLGREKAKVGAQLDITTCRLQRMEKDYRILQNLFHIIRESILAVDRHGDPYGFFALLSENRRPPLR